MRWFAATIAFILTATLLTACGSDNTEADRPVVRIFGPYRGEEAALFTAGLDDWADSAGIEVQYTGSGSFVSDLQYQVSEILSPPDIAIVPQSGVVRDMSRDGHIVAVDEETTNALERHYDEAALDLGRVDGTLVGFPYRANVKSLVWYRPTVLADLGLALPQSLDQLESLVERLEELGVTPWCLGIEAQQATGWPATDWVEDLIVRQVGPDVYDQWVSGATPFSDDRIADAFASFRELVLEPGRVAGGTRAVLRTSTQASDDPLFTEPAGCVLFKQASFAYGWMPAGLELGPDGDIDFFVLPGVEPGEPPPLVAGADLAVAFNNRPAVSAVMRRLATPEAGIEWAQRGGYVSPRSDVEPASYYQPGDRVTAELLSNATLLVPDGSDTMPPDIGTTLFWTQITSWLSGQISYEKLAQTLDDARETDS